MTRNMDDLFTPSEDRKIEKQIFSLSGCLSIFFGLAILIAFVYKVSESHSLPKNGETLILANYGAFGDFIAGLVGTFFALGGFFLLYLTLKDQRENFQRERLESSFFEMIKMHRENVSEMQYSYYEEVAAVSSKLQRNMAEKRKVFKMIYSQFKEAWFELEDTFDKTDIDTIYDSKYLEYLKSINIINDRQIDLKQFAQIDIVYSIVFFGLSKDDQHTIFSISSKRYNQSFLKNVLDIASLKPTRESQYWDNWSVLVKSDNDYATQILKKRNKESYNHIINHCFTDKNQIVYSFTVDYPNEYVKYYGGHQFRLGHYFRHLYQTITFIDNEKYLTPIEKYKYIKILRGQLSNYEQIIFFLNSISEVGRIWEFESDNEEKNRHHTRLITEYNLIKNIPNQYIAGDINIFDYYPEVEYEVIKKTPYNIS